MTYLLTLPLLLIIVLAFIAWRMPINEARKPVADWGKGEELMEEQPWI